MNQKLFDSFVSNPRVQTFEGREGKFYKVNKLVYYIYGQEGSGKTFSTRLEYGGKGKVGKVSFNKGVPNFDNYNGECNSVCNNNDVRICEKHALTVAGAAVYFGIGEKKLRSMITEYSHLGLFIQNGVKYTIKRKKFEDFLNNASVI